MHEHALRTVLLIQAVEESDRSGEVLPLADRTEATRSAAREDANTPDAAALSPAVQRFLVRRAERLYERLLARAPSIGQVFTLASGSTWLGRALLLLALASGASLAALDGSRQINILAFPLIGLILWNLLVFLVLIAARLRRRREAHPSRLAGAYERWVHGRIEALLRRSSQFNAPLAAALRRFAAQWSTVAHPLIELRAKRLFHLAAACVALGLVAGLYVRGIVLRYEAGWESTFLEPGAVRALLVALYGPASALTGIALPSSAEIATLRWTGAAGGGHAAPWIHLIAVTALLYIVLPRLLVALAATGRLWRLARHASLPWSLSAYARGLLVAAGQMPREIVAITSYAYEPPPASLEGLRQLLGASLGGAIELDVRDTVRYGEEDAFTERLAQSTSAAEWNVLLMPLGATPEVENHGIVIAGLRDALARSPERAPLLVVIDEASYAARMRGDASFEARVAERRRLWRDFVAGYGLSACMVDLTRASIDRTVDPATQEAVRTALRLSGSHATAR